MNLSQLAELLFPGSTVINKEALPGGLSARTTAVSLTHPSVDLIIRQPDTQAADAAINEFRVLQRVHELGLHAPEPLWLDTTGALLGSPGVVMRRIDGEPDYDPADRGGAARLMATQLARLHGAAVFRFDLSFLPHADGRIGAMIQNLHHAPDPLWQEQDVRQRVLEAWPVSHCNLDALLHGDFWPGNVLWRDGKLAGVVDWEDAMLGSPLLDFAIARLDILLIFGDTALVEFDARYRANVSHNFTNLPLWDLVAALRLGRFTKSMAQGWSDLGRPDITETFIRETLWTFVKNALENCKL